MPLPDDPDAFESAFRAAVAAVLPATTVERVDRTIIAIKLRVDLDSLAQEVRYPAGTLRYGP